MADLPIPFSAPMVAALLAGTKTQTRRLLTADKLRVWTGGLDFGGKHVRPDSAMFAAAMNNARDFRFMGKTLAWVTDPAPHQRSAVMAQWQGKLSTAVGDRLYVRESYYQLGHWEPVEGKFSKGGRQKWAFTPDADKILFDAPAGETVRLGRHHKDPSTVAWHKRLGRFMAKKHSRLTLIVTDVRVERLQAISEADALSEGVPADDDYAGSFAKEYCDHCGGSGVHGAFGAGYGVIEVDCAECETAKLRYRNLWNHINGSGSWDANPWVMAVSFTVHRGNIDQLRPTG